MKVLFAIFLSMLLGVSVQAESTTPSESVYQLKIALTSQANRAINLDVYRGQPTLITMFYGGCPDVCPLLIETLQGMERSLSKKDLDAMRILMVSIDPDRDSPAALAALAKVHRIDLSRWTLARAGATDVRKLAAVLNVQYRKLPDGNFNHSTVITLLDSTGRILAGTSKLGTADDEFMKALMSALQNSQAADATER